MAVTTGQQPILAILKTHFDELPDGTVLYGSDGREFRKGEGALDGYARGCGDPNGFLIVAGAADGAPAVHVGFKKADNDTREGVFEGPYRTTSS